MINMSYGRQENTYAALREALGDVSDHINEEAQYPVSEREIMEFRHMMQFVVEFMYENDLLDEDGELDDEALCRVCEAMSHGMEE